MYEIGISVIVDNKIGIITQVLPDNEYFVAFNLFGRICREDEMKEWHGAW